VRKCRVAPLADIAFNGLPGVLVVADLLAIGAYGQEAFQQRHLCTQGEDPFRDDEARRQFVHIHRLVQEVVRAGVHRLQIVLLPRQGGEDHDVRVLRLHMRPDQPAEVQPVKFWHHPVGDDELGVVLQKQTPRGLAVFRGDDLVPQLPELCEQDQTGHVIVFSDKDLHALRLT
jgi:hypothetical protein